MDDVYHIYNKNIEHQFLSDDDMKRKKTQTWHQSWYTASRGFMRRYGIEMQMLNNKPLLMILLQK